MRNLTVAVYRLKRDRIGLRLGYGSSLTQRRRRLRREKHYKVFVLCDPRRRSLPYKKHSRALRRLFWLVPLCLAAAGCAWRGEYRKVRSQLDYLETSQQAVQARLDSLSRELDRVQNGRLRTLDSLNQVQLDLLYEARAENRNLYHLVDERLIMMERRQQEKLEHVSRRAALARPGPVPDTARLADGPDSVVAPPDPRQVFNLAYLDLVQGRYELAIAGFREIMARYPQNIMAVEAQYWVGEAYYARQEYAPALEEFKHIITWYPHFEKMPVVLYKAGLCGVALDGPESAGTYWGILQERFPQSPEAALAREKKSVSDDGP